jgi:folate-binding protein YgfZ
MEIATATIHDQVHAVRTAAGAWLRDDYAFVRFTGKDVATWLQSQTSNDVVNLESGQGHANAQLERKGHLIAHFTLHRWDDEYWMLVETRQVEALLEQLDAHLFIEDVQIENASTEVDQVLVQGPRTMAVLASVLDSPGAIASNLLPSQPWAVHPIEILEHQVLAFRASVSGEDGFILAAQAGEGEALLEKLLAVDGMAPAPIGPEAQEVLRIEAGIPRFGLDMDGTNRLPETTLERDAVSYEKGCYIGQEVIAKLKAYSSVRKALVGLEFDGATSIPQKDAMLYLDDEKVGEMKSAIYSPTRECNIALAYIERDHRIPGASITLSTEPEGPSFQAGLVILPFVQSLSNEERAQALYDEALGHFEDDLLDQDDTAIAMLKEAVLLNTVFEDAYESLGVILHRHGRTDEAIHYMKALEGLNPDSVMAHTNLSVFYVAKGMIDEAEEEKAKAAVVGLKHARHEAKAEELAAEERARLREEALGRIEMFKEVLEIDAEDSLATFGMGQAYIQLNEYEQAIPYLEQATKVQKDYSVAFLNLGKCHEFLDHTEAAIATYQQGVEAANRKGDFMPLREMERRLKNLQAG